MTSEGKAPKQKRSEFGRDYSQMRVSVLKITGKNQVSRVLLTALVALMVSFFYTGNAKADFRVCNATQQLVGVAIGYRARAGWITEGWWHVEPTKCKTLIEGALASRYYYLYAEDALRGGRWEGPINMCVAEREFKITGTNDCFARGYQRAGFREYDTQTQQSWMVQLVDAPAETEQSQSAVTIGEEETSQ